MKDNFDVYNWKQGQNSTKKNIGEFDLYEWNKKRYLGELDIDQYDTLNVNKDDEGSSFNVYFYYNNIFWFVWRWLFIIWKYTIWHNNVNNILCFIDYCK